MYSNKFEVILKLILEHEGGKSNNKYDSGGKTNRGITQRTYDDQIKEIRKSNNQNKYNPIDKDVDYLTEQEVKDFYYYQFERYKANLVDNPNTCYVFFDSIVNLGPLVANKILQRACGLKDDGCFGKDTLNAVNSHNQRNLQLKMLQIRQDIYKQSDQYQHFKKGWEKRIQTIMGQIEKGII